MIIFWDVAPYSLVQNDRRFRGAYCLHHQTTWEGDRVRRVAKDLQGGSHDEFYDQYLPGKTK
jgi:hypothetical protein